MDPDNVEAGNPKKEDNRSGIWAFTRFGSLAMLGKNLLNRLNIKQNSKLGQFLVVTAYCIIDLFSEGVPSSFGTFLDVIEVKFNVSKQLAVWVGTFLAAIPLLTGPFAPFLMRIFGCRSVTMGGALVACMGFILAAFATSIFGILIFFGGSTGFGLGFCKVAAVVTITEHFGTEQSFVNGIAQSGGAIGTILYPLIAHGLIELEGFSNAVTTLSGGFLLLCLCALVLNNPENVENPGNRECCGDLRNIFKNTKLVLFIISNFLMYIAFDIPYAYLESSTAKRVFSLLSVRFLMPCIGLCNIFGNFVFGYVGDKKGVNAQVLYGVSTLVSAGAVAVIPFTFELASDFPLFLATAMFGLGIAGNCTLTSSIIIELVGLNKTAAVYGYLLLFQGFGTAIGLPLSGYLCDLAGDASLAFWIGSVFIFLSGLFAIAPYFVQGNANEVEVEEVEKV